MKHIKSSLIVFGILAVTIFISTGANATFLVEPHLGYNISGTGKASSVGHQYNNPEIGLRFGGDYLGFIAGFDYTFSSYTWEQTPGGNDDFHRKEFGIFLGYNFPALVRGWGTYYFTNRSEDQDASGRTSAGAMYKGETFELGAGFTPIPFLSLNIMYRMITLDTKPGTITSEDISSKEIVLGVSSPITW